MQHCHEKVFEIASITKTFTATALVKTIVDNPDKFCSDQTKEDSLSEETIPVKSESGFANYDYSDANYNIF